MADVNANIGVNIDTSDALGQLKNLQRQISQFHQSVAKSSSTAAVAQRDLQKNFLNSVNAIQGFSAELRTVRTTAETFSNSLEKNKLSMREYFRYAAGASGKFSKSFAAEFSTIEKTAIERVKTLQTQYVKMGRDANGAMQAIAIRPTTLNMKDLGTQTAIAAQKQVIFNQLIKQGSTNLLNFGKNTQWAGRQLMVGFTLPLATLGMTAGRVFMDMEKAAIKFKKVYGDLFTAPEETEAAMESIVELGKQYTAYGVAVSDALSMAADAAAAGFAGADLQNQTAAALKLSVLGQLELNKALETTISLQNAFGISSADLATEIDFLNAVENQTVISLDDMTTAVPKVAPVIQSLGGDVRDLAFFMAAMKEGGINASEGANALKSGLASLINPTQRARDMLSGFGVNLRGIIDANQGDVTGVVVDFAKALDNLDPLNRAQAIEQLFGKFQFARLSTLFQNVAKDGTQASRVLELAGSSVEELAALSEGELGVAAASSMNKFLAAVENIKLALAPIGETFLQIATPIIEFGTKMLEAFNNLPDGIKKSVTAVITIIGGIGPIALMTFGLINNGIANMIKFFATVRLGYLRITGQAKGVGDETQYMTTEQLEAAAAAASLDQAHSNLTQRFTAEKIAVDALRTSYEQAVAAGNRFALLNPGMMKPGSPAKFAKGGFVSGSGTGDTVPAMLTPGEYVINKQAAQEMMPLLEAINSGQVSKFEDGGAVGRNVSFEGKAYDTLGVRSSKAIDAFVKTLESSKVSLDSIAKMLDTVESKYEKLSAERVKAAAAEMGLIKEKDRGSNLQRMHLQEDIATLPTGERMMGSLVRPGLERQNQRLRRGQDPDEFMGDWTSVKDGLIDSLTLGGMEITDEVREMAQAIDTEIAEAAVILARATEKGLVDDKLLAKATDDVIKANQELGGTRAQIAQTMTDRKGARVLAPATKESLLTAGVIQEGETWTAWVKGLVAEGVAKLKQGTGEIQVEYADGVRTIARVKDDAVRDALASLSEIEQKAALVSGQIGDKKIAITTGNRSALDPNTYLDTPTAKTKAVVVAEARQLGQEEAKARAQGNREVAEATQDPYLDKRDRNSPHPQAAKDGLDDAKSYDAAFQQQTAMVKSRGPRRSSSDGNVVWDEQSKQYMSQAKNAQVLEGRQKGLARATQMSINKVSAFSERVSKASFAVGSIAGVATMFGGKIGEVASIIMQVTLLFSALAAVTSKLITAQSARLAMDMVTNLGSGRTAGGALGKAGGFMGGAKGMEGFKNILTNLGKVFAQLMPRVAAAAGVIGGALTAAATALGVSLGVLLGGFAAIAAVIVGGVVAYKIARDNVTKLGETANLSAEKLKTLGDIFGVTAREADFAGKFTGTTAKTGEEQNKVNMVLESENFEADFKTQIEAIKTASKEDAESVLQSTTTQLSAAGFGTDAVEAIINAIAIKAGRKDLDLKFSSISFSSPEGLAAVDTVAKQTVARVQTAFAGKNVWDSLGMGEFSKQVTTASAQFTTAFQALQIGFREGEISAQDLMSSMGSLNAAIMSLDPSAARDLVNTLAKDLGIEDKVSGLESFEDKLLLINATAAEIEIPEKVVKSLAKASKAGASKKDLETAAKLRKEINDLIKEETQNIEEAKNAEEEKALVTAAVQDAKTSIEEEITGLQNEATAYQILTDAGWDAASAMAAVSDASIAQGLAMAATADERQGLINDLAALMQLRAEADARKVVTSGGGGGGGSKSPMQEALEDLGKQRTEIKNNITAYAGLRKAGFSAAQAAEVAGDATLAAALASEKVGSAKWKQLVNQIRLVRIEALKTSEGLRNAFDGLKGQADDYYSILERQTERKFADGIKAAETQAKRLSRAIEDLNDVTEGYQEEIDDIQRDIEIQFDRPIEALNEETSDLANDLTLMDRAANKITERYDEQAQALDNVNRINQRIIAQQKQQVGLASALVEGDISAAAAAVQDIRAANAEAAGQSVGDMLNTAKQAEIDALRSESGMSRVEIEERQFEISQEIFDLEEKREKKLAAIRVIEDKIYDIQENQIEPLEKQQKANDKVLESIEDQRDAQLEAIDAQRQKWEDAELALDAARIEAGEFNNVIDMAKQLTGDVVANWKQLSDKTAKLTIETVMKEIGDAPTSAAIVKESGSGGGGGSTTTTTPTTPVDDKSLESQTFGESLKNTPFSWLGDPVEAAQSWWDAIVAWFKDLPNKVGEAVGNLWSGIQSIPVWLGEQWGKFKTWLSELPYNIGYSVGSLWGKIQNIGIWLATQWENFKTWATVTLPNGVKEWGANLWASIQSIGPWLATQWENFKTWVTVTLPNGIKNWAVNLWTVGLPNFGSWLAARAEELRLWIVGLPGRIGNWATNLWDGFWSGFKAGESATKSTGGKKATGGMIYRNAGGDVPGQGNTDSVNAMLTPGEYVINKRATAKFRPVLKAINSGTFGGGLDAMRYKAKAPTYSPSNLSGGVYNVPSSMMNSTPGSMVSTQAISSTQMDNSVYNYSLSVNVNGSNANADDIANNVISKIKRMDSQRLRKQVVS
jgi:TP901 family phage tail tape measure protein